jgi:hypothetical protein
MYLENFRQIYCNQAAPLFAYEATLQNVSRGNPKDPLVTTPQDIQ